jgi:flagellar motor switch protein FliM
MPNEEMVTVMRFQASMNDSFGTFSICLPAPVLAPGSAIASFDPAADQQNLHRNILQSAVELRALLAETKLRLSDVISMQVGDVITTDVSADSPISVQAEGRNLFSGQLGHLRGTRAIEVTKAEDLS